MKSIIVWAMLLICFSTVYCKTNKRKPFAVSIEYSSPWAYPVKYLLNEQSITVNGVKNKSSRLIQNVYSRRLDDKESDSIYNFLRKISTDTLRDTYDNPGFFDGTTQVVQVSGQNIKFKRVMVYMRSTQVTDTLESIVENAVFESRYKWANYYKN